MKNYSFNKKSQGFSLIELLLVLAIIAALAIAAFIVYPRVMAGRNATYETQVLSAAAASAKGLFTSGSYGGLTNTVANNADFFPSSMKTGAATIENQWNGDVVISGSDTAGASSTATNTRLFRIVYPNVPSDVCTRLAASAAQNFGAVFVAGGADATGPGTAVKNSLASTIVPIDEAAIATNCNDASGRATITLVSN